MRRLRRSECPKPLHNWIYSPPLTTRSDLLSKKKETNKPSTLPTGCHFPLSSLQEQHSQLGQMVAKGGKKQNKTKHNTTQHNTTTGHKLPTPYKQIEKEQQKARFLDIKTCSFSPSIRSQREHIVIVSPCSALSTSPLRDSVDLESQTKKKQSCKMHFRFFRLSFFLSSSSFSPRVCRG